MAKPILKQAYPEDIMMKTLGRYIALLILFSFGVYLLCKIAAKPDYYQHDFRNAYYYCTKAWMAGINPYDDAAVKNMFPGKVNFLSFRYPPLTLYIFRVFGTMDYYFAYYLFLFLKTAALTGLILLWRDKFFDGKVGSRTSFILMRYKT